MGSAGRKGKTPLVNRQQRGGGEGRRGRGRRGEGEGKEGEGEGRGGEGEGRHTSVSVGENWSTKSLTKPMKTLL